MTFIKSLFVLIVLSMFKMERLYIYALWRENEERNKAERAIITNRCNDT